MTIHASGTFDVDSWDQQAYDEREGASLVRARVTKTFRGELQGTSSAELLMTGSADGRSRAYVGLERIEGSLGGRRGSFVLHHTAIASPDLEAVAWTVVPDTGTGELLGLCGTMQIVNEPDGGHTWTLDYELAEVAGEAH